MGGVLFFILVVIGLALHLVSFFGLIADAKPNSCISGPALLRLCNVLALLVLCAAWILWLKMGCSGGHMGSSVAMIQVASFLTAVLLPTHCWGCERCLNSVL